MKKDSALYRHFYHNRMLHNETQRESRVRENFTHGLVGEVKPSFRRKRGFTLIERVPRKVTQTSRMISSDPTSSPIRVGSLATGNSGNVYCRSVVTKSLEGKCRQGTTRNQSKRQGKFAGRRKTNSCKHRKGDPSIITDRDGYFGNRASVRWAKVVVVWEETGEMHHMSQRCKRRRHAEKVCVGNWGDPVGFRRNGVMANDWVHTETRNQMSLGICCRNLSLVKEQMRKSRSIRRNAESGGDVLQEVGGGHSSYEGESNIKSLSEGPLVCEVFSKRYGVSA